MDKPSNVVPKLRPPPSPLPTTYEDMLKGKITKVGKNLNDHVDDIHNLLWLEGEKETDDGDDPFKPPSYRKLIDAVYDEDAVEGSTTFDDHLLALMIISKAKAIGNTYVATKKPATIAKAHRVVLNRYGLGRKQRRGMLHGEAVDPNGEN